MATDNPRIAAYVPKAIHDRLREFKEGRELKSESQAITVALSEFFGVSQEVAYQSSSDLVQRIEALETSFIRIKDELLNELTSELLKSVNSEASNELPGESQNELPMKQLELPSSAVESNELRSELDGNIQIEPLSASDLSRRFGLDRSAVAKAKSYYKNKPEKFAQWFQSHDPNGLNWEYRKDTKLYYPVGSS